MDIKDGIYCDNKTRKYLLPVMSDYGEETIKTISGIFKLGVGIDDAIIPEDSKFQYCIFILADINIRKKFFEKAIVWFREQEFFITDYSYDDVEYGNKHMIVLKVPDSKQDTYIHFLNSEFSKMYNDEDLTKYFKEDSENIKVIKKDIEQLKEFVDLINKEYESEYTPEEWLEMDNEVDFPLVKKEEIFNYNLIHTQDGREREVSTGRDE